MAKFSVEEGEGPSSPKRRRRAGGGEGEGEGEGNVDEVEDLGNEKMISVKIDPDVLDCSICLEPLLTPVFQCQNGHTACCSCWIKLKNKCHSCSLQIGSTRCLAIEKVIESIKIRCRNSRYGCKETLSYSHKSTHEELCVHAPCGCPISDCKFIGSPKQLSLHFSSSHCVSPARFRYNCPVQVCLGKNEPLLFLQGDDGLLFLVNNKNEQMGNVVFLIAVEQSSSKGGYAFDLVTRKGARSLQLKSYTGSIMKQPEVAPSTDYLVVPSDFHSCHEQLNLEVCIRSARERG